MGLSLTHEVLSLELRDPFRIARSAPGEGARITTVIVELRDERYPGVVGVGEGYPEPYYGETPGRWVKSCSVWPGLWTRTMAWGVAPWMRPIVTAL